MTNLRLIQTTAIVMMLSAVICIAVMIHYAEVAPDDKLSINQQTPLSIEEQQPVMNPVVLRKTSEGKTIIPLAAESNKQQIGIVNDLIGQKIHIYGLSLYEGTVITTDFAYCSEIEATSVNQNYSLVLQLRDNYEHTVQIDDESLVITYCELGSLPGKKVILCPEACGETEDPTLQIALETIELLSNEDISVYSCRVDENVPEEAKILNLCEKINAQLFVSIKYGDFSSGVKYNAQYFRRDFDNAMWAYLINQQLASRLNIPMNLSSEIEEDSLLGQTSMLAAGLELSRTSTDELGNDTDFLVQQAAEAVSEAIKAAYEEHAL